MELGYLGRGLGYEPPNCRFYAVATSGGNFIQLIGATPGKPGTLGPISTPTFFMDGVLGQSAKYNEANFSDVIQFPNQATIADTSITIGILVSNLTVNASGKLFFSTDGAGVTNGWTFGKDSSNRLTMTSGGAVCATSSGITLAASQPYFLGVSECPTAANFIMLNLLTGSVITSSVVASLTATAPNGTYLVGNRGGNLGFGGNMSESIAMAAFFSPTDWCQWADGIMAEIAA